jgi:hypothetical protein
LLAVLQNDPAIRIRHVQAIDHHHGAQVNVQAAAALFEHLGHVRVFEIKRAVDFVVFFIKRAAGDEDFDGHGIPYKT